MGRLGKSNSVAGQLTLLERKRLELARALATNPKCSRRAVIRTSLGGPGGDALAGRGLLLPRSRPSVESSRRLRGSRISGPTGLCRAGLLRISDFDGVSWTESTCCFATDRHARRNRCFPDIPHYVSHDRRLFVGLFLVLWDLISLLNCIRHTNRCTIGLYYRAFRIIQRHWGRKLSDRFCFH